MVTDIQRTNLVNMKTKCPTCVVNGRVNCEIHSKLNKTPLTDEAILLDGHGVELILASDSREIELRLNECVEVLEKLADEWKGWSDGKPPTNYLTLKQARLAIFHAKKPL